MTDELNERLLMRQWYALAFAVHNHFGLSANERLAAIRNARQSPYRALKAYKAIANSLTPHYPARGARG